MKKIKTVLIGGPDSCLAMYYCMNIFNNLYPTPPAVQPSESRDVFSNHLTNLYLIKKSFS